MKIAIYGAPYANSCSPFILELFTTLEKNKCEILVYEPFLHFLAENGIGGLGRYASFDENHKLPLGVDFLISIGGDGTFLKSIPHLNNFNIPLIGLNTGRLGFLANIAKEETDDAIQSIFKGEYHIEPRTLLSLSSPTHADFKPMLALNEVTVQKADSDIIAVKAAINGQYLNTYWTDGLIVATSTGSTAYSLSIGGPIVTPDSPNFIIAPIASHNLSVRPLVVPDNVELEIQARSRNGKFLITADNNSVLMADVEHSFIIKKHYQEVKMLRLPFNNYYATLRNKLMWGNDKRNW